MPTPADVFNAFYDKKYEEVIELLKKDSTLVNASSEKSQSSLFQLSLLRGAVDENSQALLKYLVTHPQLDFSLKSSNGSELITNSDALISSERIDLLKEALKDPMNINPTLIEGDGQLTYQLAVDELKLTQENLARSERRRPNSSACTRLREAVATLTDVVSLVRDATILHALAQDDVTLLKKLELVGGDPTSSMGALGGGKPLAFLVTRDKTNIRGWLKELSAIIDQRMRDNPNSFYNRGLKASQLENKIALLEKDYLEKKVALIKEGVENEAETVTSLHSQGTSIKK